MSGAASNFSSSSSSSGEEEMDEVEEVAGVQVVEEPGSEYVKEGEDGDGEGVCQEAEAAKHNVRLRRMCLKMRASAVAADCSNYFWSKSVLLILYSLFHFNTDLHGY